MPSTLYTAWEGSRKAGRRRKYHRKVDEISGDKSAGVGLFFCTHAHTDHLAGLCDCWEEEESLPKSLHSMGGGQEFLLHQ